MQILTCMVVFLSKYYPEKDWTNFEIAIGKRASQKRPDEYLLPIRLDDTPVVGRRDTLAHIVLRRTTVEGAAETLCRKLAGIQE